MAARDLLIRLLGDPSGALKAMKEAEGGASKMGGTLKHAAEAAAVGVTAVAGAAVAMAGDSVKAFSSLAGNIARMQRLTGGSAEDMSRLAFAAHETGVSQETLEKSIVKMSKSVETQGKIWYAHGIATKDAQGHMLSFEQIMANASNVFAKMPNGVEKTALAVQLFGKSGAEMIPMLNRGGKGLDELAKESDKFGLTIGQKSVDAYKKNLMAGREMHAAWEGLKVQIGEKLMPVIAKVTSWFAEHLPAALAVVHKMLAKLQPIFDAIGQGLTWLSEWFEAHWAQIQEIVRTAIEKVREVIAAVTAVVEAIWRKWGSNILDYLTHVWEYIKSTVKNAIEIVRGIIEVVTNLIHGRWGKVWDGIKKIVEGVWNQIRAYIKLAIDEIKNVITIAWGIIQIVTDKVWKTIKAMVKTPIDGIKDIINGAANVAKKLWDGMENAARSVWGRVKSIVTSIVGDIKGVISGIWDGLKAGFVAVLNWVIDKANMLIRGANELPFVNIPQIPLVHLATGGTIASAGLALVGERGPEVVALPKGATVYPHGMMPTGGGTTIHQTFQGIFDPAMVARQSSRELAWALAVH